MNSAVYWGQLMHNRLRPKKHRFCYRIAPWVLDLNALESLSSKLRFFSINRFNLVSFHEKDYGDGSGRPLQKQIQQLLAREKLCPPTSIKLLCFPRVLGYVFNPLSVYYCFDATEKLYAVVYEVSNTFGERHSYVIPAPQEEADQKILHQAASKQLHVSPFFPMDCHYTFRLTAPSERLTLGIHLHDQQGKLFGAVFTGKQCPLNDRNILKQTALLPLQTIKVIAAIHWEALRLFVKGISVFKHKPAQNSFSYSRGWAGHSGRGQK